MSALDSVGSSFAASLGCFAANCVDRRASSGRSGETDSADGPTTWANAVASLGAGAVVVD